MKEGLKLFLKRLYKYIRQGKDVKNCSLILETKSLKEAINLMLSCGCKFVLCNDVLTGYFSYRGIVYLKLCIDEDKYVTVNPVDKINIK